MTTSPAGCPGEQQRDRDERDVEAQLVGGHDDMPPTAPDDAEHAAVDAVHASRSSTGSSGTIARTTIVVPEPASPIAWYRKK